MFNLDTATILSRIVTLIIAFSFHEFAHAWTANAFGDNTPRANGRLTLNPAAHLDLMGTIMLLFAGFGWARPVPIDPYVLKRRSPSAVMWVSFAGPLSNLLLAVLAAIPLRLGLVPFRFSSGMLPSPFEFLIEFISINLMLLLFNLIPLAPLDGEKIAEYLFPPAWANFMETIRPYGLLILMALIFVGPRVGIDLVGWILGPALIGMLSLLIGV